MNRRVYRLSAQRQDPTRPLAGRIAARLAGRFDLRFGLLALTTFGVIGGLSLVESRREGALARAHRASEGRELDERFGREQERLEARLLDLRTQAIRAIPFADRKRYPRGVVSASVWARTPGGATRVLGLEPEGVWEQALYRVLPAEIAKRNGRAVLPLVGPDLAADPSAETLRLALFPEEGGRVSAVAFRPHVLFVEGAAADGMKRYLIEESGLVLAHANATEVGTRTSALADLFRREAARAPDGIHRIRSKSWEGFPSTIRFARPRGWNAFLVMEKVHAPIRAAASPVVILIVVAGGLLGVLFLGLAFMRPRTKPSGDREAIAPAPIPVSAPKPTREIVEVPAEAAPPRRGIRELRANPPPFVPKAPAITLGARNPATSGDDLSSELGKFLRAREARSETHERNRIRREKILLEEFEADAKRARNLERLEAKLVESASGATKSPALFFRYDPRQGIARLSAEAGYPASQSVIDAGGMSFALEAALATEIHAETARGRRKNLWEYPPLARVMLTRLGIANFEAWAMTEARDPRRGPSRLLGVLVVAESGVDSVLHRDFLGALLERASSHYTRQNPGTPVG